MEAEDQPIVISYPKDSPLATCNGKSIPGKVLMYQSNDGYTGKDGIQTEVFFANGTTRKLRILILVK